MKYLKHYIFILLLAIGFFSPIFASTTFAATTYCDYTTVPPNITQAQIDAGVQARTIVMTNGVTCPASQLVGAAVPSGTPGVVVSTNVNSVTGTQSTSAAATTFIQPSCNPLNPSACILYAINVGLQKMGTLILNICGLMLWVAGFVLNNAIIYTVLNMKGAINGLPGILVAWKTIRDFINMFFIFILLYTAIGTILDLDKVDWKKTVGNLILLAIFINFSLLMTEALIDASNLAAVGFYNGIQITTTNTAATTDFSDVSSVKPASGASFLNGGLSGAIMEQLDLTKIYDTGTIGNTENILNSIGNFLASTLGGSVFIVVTAFVFFAMAILFVIRFVILIFLIIFSPIAFVGLLGIGKLSSYSKMWWDKLIDQLIFAPAMMAMLWICLKMLGGLTALTSNSAVTNISASGASVAAASPGFISIAFNFILLIIFMVASLIIAKKAGASGGDFATKWAGKASFGAAAKISQQTFGKYAAYRASDKDLQQRALQKGVGGTIARLQLASYKGVSDSSFDLRNANKDATKAGGLGEGGKGGYSTWLKDQTEKAKKDNKAVGDNISDDDKEMVGTLDSSLQKEARALLRSGNSAGGGANGALAAKAYGRDLDQLKAATSNLDAQNSALNKLNKDKEGETDPAKIQNINDQIRAIKENKDKFQENIDTLTERISRRETKALEEVLVDIKDPSKKLDVLDVAIAKENIKRKVLGQPPIDRKSYDRAINSVGIRRTTGIKNSKGEEQMKTVVQNDREKHNENVVNNSIPGQVMKSVNKGTNFVVGNAVKLATNPIPGTGKIPNALGGKITQAGNNFVTGAGKAADVITQSTDKKVSGAVRKELNKDFKTKSKIEDTLKSYLDEQSAGKP